MPKAVRLGDMCTGHSCPPTGWWPSRESTGSSENVKINDMYAHRVTDAWASHCCGDPCHSSNLSDKEGTVFVNNLRLGKIGDAIDCGSTCDTGSPTVYVEGQF